MTTHPTALAGVDRFDAQLAEQVAPADWHNPTPAGRYNLVVIGGGTAGLVAAMGAATLGARVALVEKHRLGGDCLNTGCVPSKALLRAARAAYDARAAGGFGARAADGPVDFARVMARMRRLRANIATHDAATRFADAGIDLYFGAARFTGRDTAEVSGTSLRFARALIATGAVPAVPPVPGLASSGYLTSDTVFTLSGLPRRLLVVGAGPIGCELAQAFRRFGSDVCIISRDPGVLPLEDPDASAILAAMLRREGIELALGAELQRVERAGSGITVTFHRGRGEELRSGDALLLAVGRVPAAGDLGLEDAGVTSGRHGIDVDHRLRTRNRRIYAAGDACSAQQLTHAADAMARVVLQNALFFGRKKASALVIPHVTYTDPEIAHVGMYESEAMARGLRVATYTVPLADIDRAVLDGDTDGFARLHVDAGNGRIIGATAVARHAGEMIGEIALAITARLHARHLADTIHPYPTVAEAWKRLGDEHRRSRLTPRLQRFLAWILARRR